MRRRLVIALATLALTTAVTACSDDDEPLDRAEQSSTTRRSSSSSSTSTSSDGTSTYTPDPIAWESCGGADCAIVEVPLDYADPDGRTILLEVARLPARGDRIGAVFVNPGGPGGSAVDLAVGNSWPGRLTDRFDIVGVEPRGVGGDPALDCARDVSGIYGADPSIEDARDREALIAVSEAYAQGCADAAGDLLPHLGTREVARDIDAVRAAMGDEQISYVGFSYGTSIGQVYADLFPDRVRAMVLDGVVELGVTGVEGAITQAEGFERALRSFADSCDASSCLGADAIAAVEDVIARAEAIDPAAGGAGPDEVAVGIPYALYSESLWPALADAVADARRGDGSGIEELADRYLGLVAEFDVYYAVSCLDSAWPEDPDRVLAASKAALDRAPHFVEAVVNEYLPCALWPVEEQPIEATRAPGTPPIVVISTTNDPATPYEAGVNTARRLESGVLLTYEGDGHTVFTNGVACVDDAVVRYLVDLEPPDDGSRC